MAKQKKSQRKSSSAATSKKISKDDRISSKKDKKQLRNRQLQLQRAAMLKKMQEEKARQQQEDSDEEEQDSSDSEDSTTQNNTVPVQQQQQSSSSDDDESMEESDSDEQEEEKSTKKSKPKPTLSFTDEQTTSKDGFLTELTFSQLGLSEPLMKALNDLSYEKLSEIQAKCIPPLLAGNDILAQAKTGSGKTLGFLIPCIELLYRSVFKVRNGTGAIIIAPTRELAIQIYNVARELVKYTNHTVALLMGGGLRSKENQKLYNGANIVIATPGRLLDHLLNTDFIFKNLKMLVLDEADRILDVGFEEELKAIVKLLPSKRQTLLFSATQTTKVADIARVAMKNKPVFVQVKHEDKIDESTARNLRQGYVLCPTNKKLMLLISFLKRNSKKKVLVFFSTCDCVQYYSELLTFMNIPVLQLHGKLSQNARTNTFFKFCNTDSGALFSTNVAARGLDIPKVDWIIQFDPPHDTREYIHRVGRTARAGRKGRALLLLTPQQKRYLFHLKDANVPLNELEIGKNLVDIQAHLEDIIQSNYYLNEKSVRAFQSAAYAYKNYSDKTIFNMKTFDAKGLATQMGLRTVPFIQFDARKD